MLGSVDPQIAARAYVFPMGSGHTAATQVGSGNPILMWGLVVIGLCLIATGFYVFGLRPKERTGGAHARRVGGHLWRRKDQLDRELDALLDDEQLVREARARVRAARRRRDERERRSRPPRPHPDPTQHPQRKDEGRSP